MCYQALKIQFTLPPSLPPPLPPPPPPPPSLSLPLSHHTQVKYLKASFGNHYHSPSSEHFHYPHQRLSSPPPSLLKPLPKRLATKRRSSIAVMELNSQARPVPSSPLNTHSLSVGESSLAEVDRHRKTSWSMVVGNCMSRSVGTGINELERSIGLFACWLVSSSNQN